MRGLDTLCKCQHYKSSHVAGGSGRACADCENCKRFIDRRSFAGSIPDGDLRTGEKAPSLPPRERR